MGFQSKKASAWLIQLRAYAMPSVPVPPVILLGTYGMVWYGTWLPDADYWLHMALGRARRAYR